MTTPVPALPSALRQGIAGLDGLERFCLDGDWSWVPERRCFAVGCLAALSVPASEHMPALTRWMLLVSAEYPKGKIDFHPAVDGGITATFPHQNRNGEPDRGRPWRPGSVCISVPRFHSAGVEPGDAQSRLRWQVLRLLAWIDAAATGTLLAVGDHVEFPVPAPASTDRPRTARMVVFSEDRASFSAWRGRLPDGGMVTLVGPEDVAGVWATRQFRDRDGNHVREVPWGLRMAAPQGTKPVKGLWVVLPDIPTVPPWALPATWGELEDACQRIAGFSIIVTVIENARLFRTGQRHPVLIGFPTEERVGEEPVRMHWLAAWMPTLSHGTVTANGFRPDERGYRQRDRILIRRDAAIEWVPTGNWAPDQLATRGAGLGRDAAAEPMLLLGAGSLGSAVGVALSRAGATDIVVMDGDVLIGGNLVRHTLGVGDVAAFKAERVAARMNDANPHASAVGVPTEFPAGVGGRHRDRIRASRVVIDCTGDDRALDDLAAFDWAGCEDRWFISLSLGWAARRLFCFAARAPWFPAADFRERIEEWRGPEAAAMAASGPPPWEGVGCWHPVFPASGPDVAAMAAIAVGFVVRVLAGETPERVFEVHGDLGANGASDGMRAA